MYKPQATRKLVRRFLRPWYLRPFLAVLVLACAAVAGRIALPSWLERQMTASFARVQDHDVRYRKLGIFMFPPVLIVEGLEVDRRGTSAPSGWRASRVEVHLAWANLWRDDQRTARVRIVHPVWRSNGTESPSLPALFGALPPARIEVLAIERGEAILPGPSGRVWLSDIDVKGKDFDTRHRRDVVAHVNGTAKMFGFADVELRGTERTSHALPERGGSLHVQNLDLRVLEEVFAARAAGAPSAGGVVGIEASIKATGGDVRGTVSASVAGDASAAGQMALSRALDRALQPVAPGVVVTLAELSTSPEANQIVRLGGHVAYETVGAVDAWLGLVRGVVVQGASAPLRILTAAPAGGTAAVAAAP